MHRVVRGLRAVHRNLAAVHGEITVQLNHRGTGLKCFGAVNLDFIIVLGQGRAGET